MSTVVDLTTSGLLLGGIYALLSVGLTLVFGVLRVVNFAHGEFLMLGMYGAYFAWSAWGLSPYLSVVPIMILTFAFGLVVYGVVIRRTIGGSHLTQVFATLGLSIVLQNVALIAFSGDQRTVRTAFAEGVVHVGPLSVARGMLVSFLIAVGLTLVLWAFLNRTLLGAAIRGIAQNRTAAVLVGVNVGRIYAVTFALGTASVGAAGALISPLYSVYPRVGIDFLLIAFVIVVLGGLGSVAGAAMASIVIGLIISFVTYYAGADQAQLAYFLLFVAVLVLRPDGLRGLRGAQEYA